MKSIELFLNLIEKTTVRQIDKNPTNVHLIFVHIIFLFQASIMYKCKRNKIVFIPHSVNTSFKNMQENLNLILICTLSYWKFLLETPDQIDDAVPK